MNITWDEIIDGCERQANFCQGYSDLYHAVFGWLAQAARQQHPGLIQLVEGCWQDRIITGYIEATLLLTAGIHAAVLDNDPAASELRPFYATVGGEFQPERDGKAIFAALDGLFNNPGEILPWFLREGRIQTNEVSRGIAWLFPACIFTAWQPDLTITLVDLGTSAGLNMAADYQGWQWELADRTLTFNAPPYLMTQQIHVEDSRDPDLSQLFPQDSLPRPNVIQRIGFDRYPLQIGNEADRLLLEAALWGDQPERVERFEQAAQGYRRMQDDGIQPRFFAGDIIEAGALLTKLIPDDVPTPHLLLVFNSAVTTYLDDTQYEQLRQNLMHSFNHLPEGVRGIWLEAEAPRFNEQNERPKFWLVRARLPFMGGVSTLFLGEAEPHPQNLYLRPGWDTLRAMLGF